MNPAAEAYLHSATYHEMLDRLVRIAAEHDPADTMAVAMLRTNIIAALGETGGVWPMDCFTGEIERHGPAHMVTQIRFVFLH